MLTDLRFIIGVFFVFCGSTLVATGVFAPSNSSDGTTLNVSTGLFMLAFGFFMGILAYFHEPNK